VKLNPVASVDSGVDYLTCTYKPTAALTRLKFYLTRLEREELNAGFFSRPWNMYGYRGFRVGGLNYGWRDDSVIVRLESEVAQRWWRRFGKLASNCSRIDVQDTWTYEEKPSVVLREHWRTMVAWWKEKKGRPKPREIGGPTGIETIYSGERVSDMYLRVYDRWSKKKDKAYQGHVRYEVEVKGDRAMQLLQSLLPVRRHEVAAAGQCHELFRARGCSPPTQIHC
jgi:DNA relaxase NicK